MTKDDCAGEAGRELQLLQSIAEKVDRVDRRTARMERRAITAGAVAGGVSGGLTGGLVAVGITYIKAKLLGG